jgi:epoxyqueuosine reductase
MGFDEIDMQNLVWKVKHENSLDLLGIADIQGSREGFLELAKDVREIFPLAIVIGVRVSPSVLSTLEDGPNLLYYHHYRQLNFQLDRAASRMAQEIEREGYAALPIPASQIVNWATMKGHLPHKDVAYLAGLGWRGRNNLLITEEWGAQVRLATVLTNLPLDAGHPLEVDCGSCRRCLAVCPVMAIKEEPGVFDHLACYQQLKEFSKARRIGQYVCGLCVKACRGSAGNRESSTAGSGR